MDPTVYISAPISKQTKRTIESPFYLCVKLPQYFNIVEVGKYSSLLQNFGLSDNIEKKRNCTRSLPQNFLRHIRSLALQA
jgi:hypothetical protein